MQKTLELPSYIIFFKYVQRFQKKSGIPLFYTNSVLLKNLSIHTRWCFFKKIQEMTEQMKFMVVSDINLIRKVNFRESFGKNIIIYLYIQKRLMK